MNDKKCCDIKCDQIATQNFNDKTSSENSWNCEIHGNERLAKEFDDEEAL